MAAYGTCPDNDDLAAGDAGDSPKEHPAPAVGALKIVSADLDGETPCHLTHGSKNRQQSVRLLHRLVGESIHLTLKQRFCQTPIRRKMKIREKGLAAMEQRIFRR